MRMGALLHLALILGGPRGDLGGALAAGDEAFAAIDYQSALDRYGEALAGHPGDPDILWRVARAYVCLAEVEEGRARAAHLSRAEASARECIRADSARGEGYTWLAAALGYLALDAGTSRKLELSRELDAEAHRALAINPDDDAALSILGSFYRALGNVGWLERAMASVFVGSVPRGGYREAEEALTHAVAIAPDVMRHRYELGILYIDMGRTEEARRELEAASRLPVRTAIDRPRLLKIRELLDGLLREERSQ